MSWPQFKVGDCVKYNEPDTLIQFEPYVTIIKIISFQDGYKYYYIRNDDGEQDWFASEEYFDLVNINGWRNLK